MIAVAVGEAYWAEPGQRIMDIRIDGRVRASRIDPIVVADGKHRLAVIACEAEDGATKLENGAVVFTAQAGRTYAVHQAKESR